MKLTHSILKKLIKEQLLKLQEQADTQVACEGRGGEWTPLVGAGEQGYCSVAVATGQGGQSSPPTEDWESGIKFGQTPTQAVTDCVNRYGKGKWKKYLAGCRKHVTEEGGNLQSYRQKMGWTKSRKGKAGKVDPGRSREKTRLGRKGDKILRKNGFKGFDDFYEQLRKHDLTKLLGPSKEDRKWGGAHNMAMIELKKAKEEAKTAERDEGTATDLARAKKDAKQLYIAMKGAGTDEEAIEAAMNSATEYGIPLLYDVFNKELQKVGKEGTLVSWLRKDAGPGKDNLPFWADKVESQVRAKKEAEEALPGEEAEEEMGEEEIEDYSDEEKAAMKKAGVRFDENTTHSSFSKHQKLFENWNRYVKSIEED